MRKRRVWALVTAAAILIVLIVLATTGGADQPRTPPLRAVRGAAAKQQALPPPLKSHPRVVIAATLGELPPGVRYGTAGEAQNFQPPSDAEVRAELHQLNVSGTQGTGAYVNPFAHIANL